jgi:hypothetical protein
MTEIIAFISDKRYCHFSLVALAQWGIVAQNFKSKLFRFFMPVSLPLAIIVWRLHALNALLPGILAGH